MSQQIQFRAGQPQTFVATRSFALGNTGMTIPAGAEIQFDGNMATYAGMPPVPVPQLRGALKVGWITPAASYDPMAAPPPPVSAGIQMRPADSGNPMDPKPWTTVNATTIEDEERVVGDVNQHAAQTRENNQTNYRHGMENRAVRPGERGYEIIEPQDGVPVRTLKTAAKTKTDVTRAGTAISQASNVQIEPGQGKTREQLMAEMDPETRAQYATELAGRAAARDPEAASRIIASINTGPAVQHKEGFTVKTEVGGGTEVFDAGGTGVAGENQVTVVEEGGIKFTNTNGPKKNVRLVDANQAPSAPVTVSNVDDATCRAIAKSFCPDFPDNYDFTASPRKKIARLQADFEDRPDIIRAVAAADPDGEVKQRVIAEFPEVFGG